MTESTGSREGSEQPVRYKRKLKNYLIDRRFQLKYTGMIMALSFALILALGFLLYMQLLATVKENARAVELSADAARASADAARVSKENSEIVIGQALAEDYFSDPEVTEKFIARMEEPVEEVKAKAESMEKQAAAMEEESEAFQARATQLPILLALFGLTFLLFLFLISIYTTHKVAGPMYKIKKLMSEVDGDSLHVDGKLRKGDEMWELFLSFNNMIERLRKHQREEARELEGLIEGLEEEDGKKRDAAIEDLREFKKRMEEALD